MTEITGTPGCGITAPGVFVSNTLVFGMTSLKPNSFFLLKQWFSDVTLLKPGVFMSKAPVFRLDIAVEVPVSKELIFGIKSGGLVKIKKKAIMSKT